jgi:carboxypeptidase D
MLGHSIRWTSLVATLLLSAIGLEAKPFRPTARQIPADPVGVQTITTPGNVTLRYKEPGKEGVCETTPGVNSYSGYIDVAPDAHLFFYFFEARHDPNNAPITLWLNGGPGSDSLIGLFEELGPCNITEDLQSQLNPYSWSEVSNLLFLSQPVGVGFSYGSQAPGTRNNFTGDFQEASIAGVDGQYAVINASAISTTELAAIAAWEVLQGFYAALPQLDPDLKSRDFHLWTESYGGHYGPTFYEYFYEQNQAIANGSAQGVQLNMNSLGIINGIIDEYIQAPYYPEFAVNNTYGIKAVNDTVYNYMKFALNMPGGCLDQIAACRYTNRTTLSERAICSEASNMCRDNVEGPYYYFGDRGVYDIRHPFDDPEPPHTFREYLNQASVQNALGVKLNYTDYSNNEIYFAFQQTGDFVYQNFIEDLEMILDRGVAVSLIYGDADYICNWFGGEAVSLAINYTQQAEFNAAGYQPFLVNGMEYGEVRQRGNFSFLRLYEAGHEVPYYQPEASLEAFRRVLLGLDVANGNALTANFSTSGNPKATHTEPFVPLPTTTSSSRTSSTSDTAATTLAAVRIPPA